ncbi:MAG: glutathione S-transferase family protein [Alphaproteobacteria bacterium]|nr:glutathione S-transferase family protein [Alphaproteobacteria bacterium]
MITITTYSWVPPFAQGLVRDLRVRWALEEAGLPYRANLIAHPDRLSAGHVGKQPFAQVPVYEEDDLVLFESGAIVLHIGEKSEALLPKDAVAKARATQWIFAALNSIEQFVSNYVFLDAFYANEEWAKLRKPSAREQLVARLKQLSQRLDGRDYLEGQFTAGDLMMSSVLRIMRDSEVLDGLPNLAKYRARCEARPAFQKALADNMAPYAEHAPAA